MRKWVEESLEAVESNLKKNITYLSQSAEKIFVKIDLAREKQGRFYIGVQAVDDKVYKQLKILFQERDFPGPDFFDQDYKILSLNTIDPFKIINFIRFIQSVEPCIFEIESEIYKFFNIDLPRKYLKWEKLQEPLLDLEVAANIHYFPCKPSSKIKKLELIQYKNGYVYLCIQASNTDCYTSLKNTFDKLGFAAPQKLEEDCELLDLYTLDRSLINCFIIFLKFAEIDFSEIELDIYKILSISLSEQCEILNFIEENGEMFTRY